MADHPEDFIDVDVVGGEPPLAAPSRKPAAPPATASVAQGANVVPFPDPAHSKGRRKLGAGSGEPMRPRPVETAAGRTLPHSLEAEEAHLSCCMLEESGRETIEQSVRAGITAESFFDTKHGILFSVLLDLHHENQPISVATVAEQLKTRRQLDQVGGYSFLVQVTGRIATSAQASFFIEKVREQAVLRAIIRSRMEIVEDCYSYAGDMEGFLNEISVKESRIMNRAAVAAPVIAKGIMEHVVPPKLDSSVLLGTNRYLCRGGSLITVGPSGMGKTSISIQEPICYALGRAFMGIAPNGPLRTLIIQAEDDEGDIGEVMRSVCAGLGLSGDEMRTVNERVKVIRDNVNAGAAFLKRLAEYVAQYPCDIVRLNPLTSFFDGDLSQQKDLMPFLKGLNRVNAAEKFAFMIEHHTTKPTSGNDKAGAKSWTDAMYNMAGSSVLVNWARAIRTLEPQKVQGEFRLRLAKRGTRAGVMVEVEVGDEGKSRVKHEVTCDIFMRHSRRRMRIEEAGRPVDVPMIFWEPSTKAAGEEPEDEQQAGAARRANAGRKALFSDSEILALFPRGHKNRKLFGVIMRDGQMRLGRGLKESTFYGYRKRFLEDGSIVSDPGDGKWFVPLPEDFREPDQ